MNYTYNQWDTDAAGSPHEYPSQMPSPDTAVHPLDYPLPLQNLNTVSKLHPQAPMRSFPEAEVGSQTTNYGADGRTFGPQDHYQSQTMASTTSILRGPDGGLMPFGQPSTDGRTTLNYGLSNDQTVTSHVHSTLSSVAGNSNGNFAPNSPLFPTALVAPVIPANADAGTRDIIGSSYRPGPNSYLPASPQSHLADPMGVGGSGRMYETAGDGHHRKSSSNNRRIRVGTRMPTMSTEYSYPPSSPPPMTAATSSGFSAMINDATQFSHIPSSPHERGDQGSTSRSIQTDLQLREAIVRVIGTDGGDYTYQDHQAIPPEAKKHSPLATGSTDVMGQHHHEGPTVGVERNHIALKPLTQHLAVHPSFTPDNGHSDMSHGETAASSFNSTSPTFDLAATTYRAGPNMEPYYGPSNNLQGDDSLDQSRPAGNDKKCIFC
ncbi:hypothetical protein FRC03_005054 [Tulasnella sp. 419]|nr:hypothetical protein FRC03_005054 [Tulasnella sp. 419]